MNSNILGLTGLIKAVLYTTFLCLGAPASATLFDDIGFSDLQTQQGSTTPDGSGVPVAIAEAFTGTGCEVNTAPGNCLYRPDKAIKNYRDSASDPTPPAGYDHTSDHTPSYGFSTNYSAHATGTARLFYGNDHSTSPGISEVHVFAADHWLTGGYLNTRSTGPGSTPLTSSIRVSNHSYQGAINLNDANQKAQAREILSRIDWIVDKDEQIVATASTGAPLDGTAFNIIAVGRTDGGSSGNAVNLSSSPYDSNQRIRPDVVVPESSHSAATPRVASAAALLINYAHDQATGAGESINGKTIYNAERSEVIKAVIMAGARRETQNTDGRPDITDYRNGSHAADNGLDDRFGAGQLNIFNSYQILAAGEQEAGNVNTTGFDYDSAFGGAGGSNDTASYLFHLASDAKFIASLVWNLAFETSSGNESDNFSDYSPVLYDLDLMLYNSANVLIASSMSRIDNTENLWLDLTAGDYRLEVSRAPGEAAFNHDYALAWQTSAVPLPSSVWFLLTALTGLGIFGRRK